MYCKLLFQNVREYFTKFGEVAEVMVMKDPATRRSRGFGFITFSNPHSVHEVLALPSHTIDGKVVEPKVGFTIRIIILIGRLCVCVKKSIICRLNIPY